MFQFTPTKAEVADYIKSKPYLRIEPAGQFWKVRIGERSCMNGLFTLPAKAEQALKLHAGNVIITNKKREAKKHAKKTES